MWHDSTPSNVFTPSDTFDPADLVHQAGYASTFRQNELEAVGEVKTDECEKP